MRSIVIATLLTVAATQASAQAGQHFATVPMSAAEVADGQTSAALRQRIDKAIERVCGSYGDVVNGQFAEIADCRRAARADVERQIADLRKETRMAARSAK